MTKRGLNNNQRLSKGTLLSGSSYIHSQLSSCNEIHVRQLVIKVFLFYNVAVLYRFGRTNSLSIAGTFGLAVRIGCGCGHQV